jgi:phosphoserine aminotransferase
MSQRIHNFNAGPAVLPEPVLERAREAIWDVDGSGMGILEHSHRGKLFERVITEAEAEARRLASIPDDYAVLFVQGGASQQFAMVPMNLLPAGGTADYLLTGVWSEKAAEEAKKFGTVHVAGTTAAQKYTRVLAGEECRYSPGPAYVHLTTNNTIYGTQWRALPPVPGGAPLVADASSDIMSRPIEVARQRPTAATGPRKCVAGHRIRRGRGPVGRFGLRQKHPAPSDRRPGNTHRRAD